MLDFPMVQSGYCDNHWKTGQAPTIQILNKFGISAPTVHGKEKRVQSLIDGLRAQIEDVTLSASFPTVKAQLISAAPPP